MVDQIRQYVSIVVALALGACSDLSAVRKYATSSASVAGYMEATQIFLDRPQRSAPYLFGDEKADMEAARKLRSIAGPDLLAIQASLKLYLETLGTMAGEKSFDLDGQLVSLQKSIKENVQFGISKETVEAYSSIVGFLENVILTGVQQYYVSDLLIKSDRPFSELIDGMKLIVSLYKNDLSTERSTVSSRYRLESSYLNSSREKLLMIIAAKYFQETDQYYASRLGALDDLDAGLQEISEGHAALVRSSDNLTADEVVSALKPIVENLIEVKNKLDALK